MYDVRRLLAIARGRWRVLVASVAIAAAAAFIVSGVLTRQYEATATLLVGESLSGVSPSTDQLLAAQRLSATYAGLATTRPILEEALGIVGGSESAADLAKRVEARPAADTGLLRISVQDPDPARAAALANAIAGRLIAASPAVQGRQAELEQSIDANLRATQSQIDATQERVATLGALTKRTAAQDDELLVLEGRLVTLRSTYASLLAFSSGNATNLLSTIERAVAPEAPASPKPLLNTLLAGILGLVVAYSVLVLLDYLDDTVKSAADVQETANLATVGSIARMQGDASQPLIYRLAALLYPRSAAAEGYRSLRTNLEFASLDKPIRTLLVTSPSPGEGKTVTAANLAIVFAEAGHRVLLVDADLRKPGLHATFHLPNTRGLTTILRDTDVGLETITQETEQPNLRVLTTGPLPPNPAELLASQRMRATLDRLLADHDTVILDSPPLRVVTDAAVLSSIVDGTILVVDARRSRRAAVRQACDALARVDANVVGAVLNRISDRDEAGYARYYRTYGEAGEVAAEDTAAAGSSATPAGLRR